MLHLLRTVVYASVLIIPCSIAAAGEFNEVLNIGDKAPSWKDLPGVDERTRSLSDFAEKPVLVVVFTCNSCPFAVEYEDRIIEFAKSYGGPEGKVGVVAINVNRIEADSLPKMRERAAEKKFPFPYLFDESQQIAKAFGANYTPEVFVLDKERKVVYMGGLDDNSDAKRVKEKYLEPAVQAALQGKKPAVTETLARGCRIRYARERRK